MCHKLLHNNIKTMSIPRAQQSPYPLQARPVRQSVPITIPTGSTASHMVDLVAEMYQQHNSNEKQRTEFTTIWNAVAFERVRAKYPYRNETFLVDPTKPVDWEQVYRDQHFRENPLPASSAAPSPIASSREPQIIRDMTRVDFNTNTNPFIPPSNIYMTKDYASSFNFKF